MTKFRKMYATAGALLFVLLLFPIIAKGGSIDDVVKKAEAELRKTDMDLKTGGHKKVLEKLPEIDALVAEVQNMEPNHRRLANLISLLKTQKEKVEAKLGITLTLKTDLAKIPQPQNPAAAPEAPKATASQKSGSSNWADGKIKRAGADDAQARREEYRAEEQRKADAADAKRKTEDELKAYYRSLENIIETARNNPGADVPDIEKHLAATEKLTQEKPDIMAALIKYQTYESSWEFIQLKEASENAAVWRKNAVRKVLGFPTVRLEQIKGQKSGVSVAINQQINDVKPHLALAARYDANDPEVKRLQAEFTNLEKDVAGKVAGTKWEGHRNAPANAPALAAAGLKFFKGDKGWTDKYTVLAVAIKGKWTVQKKNILGAPILYGIAVNVAVQKEEDKKQKQARVFDGTLITAEKESVKAEPPFEGFYVGQNWMVNADSVK